MDYHRFFSQARWNLDSLGRVLLQLALPFTGEKASLVIAADDTLCRKTGKGIWAAGVHRDALRSTARRAVFSIGHNWVVLSIQLSFPFASGKTWSLPILMRLYRCKKKKGKRLASPAKLAKSKKVKWTKTRANLYGKRVRVWYKTCEALWYDSAGTRLLKIVVVRDPSGQRKDDCFFSTDRSLSPSAVLEPFVKRRPLEVAFYNAKQFLGMEDPQNRTPLAVQRTVPTALCLHTLVILWFAEHGHFDVVAYRKERPWYRQKRTPSFADMLCCLRTVSLEETICEDPGQKAPTKQVLLSLLKALKPAA